MNYWAYSILGSIYHLKDHDVEKAAECFSKSLYFNSRYVPSLIGMSNLLFENSYTEWALKYLEKALTYEPLNLEALISIGNVYYDLKRA